MSTRIPNSSTKKNGKINKPECFRTLPSRLLIQLQVLQGLAGPGLKLMIWGYHHLRKHPYITGVYGHPSTPLEINDWIQKMKAWFKSHTIHVCIFTVPTLTIKAYHSFRQIYHTWMVWGIQKKLWHMYGGPFTPPWSLRSYLLEDFGRLRVWLREVLLSNGRQIQPDKATNSTWLGFLELPSVAKCWKDTDRATGRDWTRRLDDLKVTCLLQGKHYSNLCCFFWSLDPMIPRGNRFAKRNVWVDVVFHSIILEGNNPKHQI